jgi:hypothetical protein
MYTDDYPEHHCLLIVAQDQWKEQFRDDFSSSVRTRFFLHGEHGDCEVCCTCPLCRSLEELFDPERPGAYDRPCSLCEHLLTMLKRRLGSANGLILFSHYRPIEKAMIDALFEERRVKKVFVLALITRLGETLDQARVDALETRIIAKSDFPVDGATENVILEVRRDEYIRLDH